MALQLFSDGLRGYGAMFGHVMMPSQEKLKLVGDLGHQLNPTLG